MVAIGGFRSFYGHAAATSAWCWRMYPKFNDSKVSSSLDVHSSLNLAHLFYFIPIIIEKKARATYQWSNRIVSYVYDFDMCFKSGFARCKDRKAVHFLCTTRDFTPIVSCSGFITREIILATTRPTECRHDKLRLDTPTDANNPAREKQSREWLGARGKEATVRCRLHTRLLVPSSHILVYT